MTKNSNILEYLFGLSSRVSIFSIMLILFLDAGIFVAMLLFGEVLFSKNKEGLWHSLGGLLLLGACLLAVWMIISLCVRLVRTVFWLLPSETSSRQATTSSVAVSKNCSNPLSTNDDTSRAPIPRSENPNFEVSLHVFKPDMNFTKLVMLGVLLLVAIVGGVALVSASSTVGVGTGLACIIGPGGYAILVFVREVAGRPELRLTKSGFVLSSFGRVKSYRWTDLDKSIRWKNEGSRYADAGVQFSLRNPTGIVGKVDRATGGYSNTLPEYFSNREVVNAMNQLWESATYGDRST